jgi:hypothetical protein
MNGAAIIATAEDTSLGMLVESQRTYHWAGLGLKAVQGSIALEAVSNT